MIIVLLYPHLYKCYDFVHLLLHSFIVVTGILLALINLLGVSCLFLCALLIVGMSPC